MNPFSISKPFAAAFVLLSLVSFAWGQEATRYVCLTLDNKTVRCGQLISDDGREITIQTPDMGKMIVPKIQVVRIVDAPAAHVDPPETDIELSERMLNPDRALQSTRYFFAPSAHTLKQGEGTPPSLELPLATSPTASQIRSWLGSAFRHWVPE